MFDHGSGPTNGNDVGGFCSDDTSSTFISSSDWDELFSGMHFDLICADTCVTGFAEFYDIMADYCDVFVGSQVSISNIPYDLFINDLVKNPYMDAKQFGEYIVQRFEQAKVDVWGFAAFDCSYKAAFMSAMHDFSLALIDHVEDPTDHWYMEIAKLASTYGTRGCDLYSFALWIKNNLYYRTDVDTAVTTLLSLLDDIIIANFSGEFPGVHNGLGIYFPMNHSVYQSGYQGFRFAQMTYWHQFLLSFFSGNATVDITDCFEPNNDTSYALALIKDEMYKGWASGDLSLKSYQMIFSGSRH